MPTHAIDMAAASQVDPSAVPIIKQSNLKLYVTAAEVFEMKRADSKILLIDVRTPEELQYVGSADEVMDANIPYLVNDTSEYDPKLKHYRLEPNSDFATAIASIVEKHGLAQNNATLILMCRSGDRSAKAANLLAKVGYKKVYSVIDGFEGDKATDGAMKGKRTVNGWKNANLPWSYNMPKEKLYFRF